VEEGKKKGKGGRENFVYFIKISAFYKHRLMLNVIVTGFAPKVGKSGDFRSRMKKVAINCKLEFEIGIF
jgi:hypothetical protein